MKNKGNKMPIKTLNSPEAGFMDTEAEVWTIKWLKNQKFKMFEEIKKTQ